jgi:hypothetical protein
LNHDVYSIIHIKCHESHDLVLFQIDGGFVVGNGSGSLLSASGDYYQGQLYLGDMEGQGLLYLADGSIYEGEFKHGVFDGDGIYYFSDATVYMGSFKSGAFNGFGILVFGNGTSTYIGMFENDVQNGYGILTDAEGYVLEGTFKEGSLSGEGRWSNPSGDIMVGEYVAGEQTGWHTLTQKNGLAYRIKFRAGVEQERKAIAV